MNVKIVEEINTEGLTGPTADTWESLGRGFIDYPEPSQTYGADD